MQGYVEGHSAGLKPGVEGRGLQPRQAQGWGDTARKELQREVPQSGGPSHLDSAAGVITLVAGLKSTVMSFMIFARP